MKIVNTILTCLLLLCGINAFAQKMSFVAEVHPDMVGVGESIELVYRVENANGKSFRPPNLDVFEILSGPNQSISTQSINGSWSQSITYSYLLRAAKPGSYHIPPAQVNISGKWVASNPVTVNVKVQSALPPQPGSAKLSAQDAGKDFFIKVVPNKQKAYIGEQVLVDFVLYTRKSIQNIQPLTDVVCDKSYIQDIKSEGLREIKDVTVGGQTFKSQILKRIAVFPQEAGTITVHSFEMQIDFINDVRSSPFQSLFRPYDIITKTYSTRELSFQAISLPEPAPKDFTGAVGRYSLNLSVSDIEVSTDDAISVILTLEGDGDIKRVITPKLDFGPAFEVYDPKTKEETTDESNGRLNSKKVLEYLLIPKSPGKYSISPTASYFDPVLVKYQSKKFNQVEFTVKKGSSTPKINHDAQAEEPKGFVGTLKSILVLISAIIIFGTILVLGFRLRKKKTGNKKIENRPVMIEVENKPVGSVQKSPLEGLQEYIDKGDAKGFYSEVNKSLKSWMGRKLNLSNSYDVHTILNALKDNDYSPELIARIKNVFETSEMVLYAGLDKTNMMPFIMDQVKEIMQGIYGKS